MKSFDYLRSKKPAWITIKGNRNYVARMRAVEKIADKVVLKN
jgi:hypothetical protein